MATETITSTQTPWAPQQPYLKRGFGYAQDLYNTGGPKYYPGNTVQGFGADTQQARNMYRQNALSNQGQAGALNQQMTQTLGGNFLNSNPYLDNMMDSASRGVTRNFQEAVAPSIGATFDSAGRYGSGMYQNMQDTSQQQLGSTLNDLSNNIYAGNYANERQNQMRAAALAPSTIPMNDYAASQMMNLGQQADQLGQQKINAAYQKYNFNQERPFDNAARYQSMIQGNFGGQGSRTSPLYEPSAGQNALGGAALGGVLGNWAGNNLNLGFGGTAGALGGAALGGLGGWLFG